MSTTPDRTGPYGSQRFGVVHPRHELADLSNISDKVPADLRTYLGHIGLFIAEHNVPGKDARATASKLAELVRALNVLVA